MTRAAAVLFALLVALAASAALTTQAVAGLRVPQVPVLGGGLQAHLNGFGEAINVTTDQIDAQLWSRNISGAPRFTIQIELAGDAASNTLGLYNAATGAPALYQVFPGAATNNWFALAIFRTAPDRVIVNLFNDLAVLQGTNVYLGADGTSFGFYLSGPGGTFYTQDYRNPGGLAQALSYLGTGPNSGNRWLVFEDLAVQGGGSDQDYDDCVLLLESVNPTPVNGSSWGQLKARFR